jgi:hypothetical protein
MPKAGPGLRGIAAIGWAALVLTATGVPAVRGETPPTTTSVPAAQTAALDSLDRALTRYEALLAKDNDPAHRAAARRMLEGFQQRRDALQAAFDSSRCDDLRAELNLEYHRLAAWISSPAG